MSKQTRLKSLENKSTMKGVGVAYRFADDFWQNAGMISYQGKLYTPEEYEQLDQQAQQIVDVGYTEW